jgi:drug/metabolite transporter (DMT)-like permease
LFLIKLWNNAHFSLAMASMMWAGHTIVARLSVGEVSPILMMGLRWLTCVTILWVIYHRQLRLEFSKVRARLGWVALMGGAGMAGFTAFFLLAAQYTTAVNLGITQSSIPAFVMLISLVLFGIRISRLQLAGLALSLVGVVVLVSGGQLEVLRAMQFNVGDILMLVACLCYGGYTAGLGRRIAMPAVLMLSFFAVPATLVLGVLVAVEYWQGALVLPSVKGLAYVGYSAIFPSMLAQIFFMRGVEIAGANRAGLYVNLVPVFSAFMAVLFLAETLYIYHGISLAMVLGGIYLADRHKSQLR